MQAITFAHMVTFVKQHNLVRSLEYLSDTYVMT